MRVEEIETIIQQIIQRLFTESSIPPKYALTCSAQLLPAVIQQQLQQESTAVHAKNGNYLIVDKLTDRQLAAIANLSFVDAKTELVLDYLMQGKLIFVLQYHTEATHVKYFLKKKLSELKQTCERFGMVFLKEADYATFKSYLPREYGQNRAPYVTQEQIIELIKNGNSKEDLPNHYKLTPLAKDYVESKRLDF